jgi:hypothetical protein
MDFRPSHNECADITAQLNKAMLYRLFALLDGRLIPLTDNYGKLQIGPRVRVPSNSLTTVILVIISGGEPSVGKDDRSMFAVDTIRRSSDAIDSSVLLLSSLLLPQQRPLCDLDRPQITARTTSLRD